MKKELPKILIVDDQPANIFALRHLLEDENLEIFSAESGNESLALMLRHDFAVVLMDVMMPEMDGFETVSLMHTNDEIRDTPVIFLTAINTEDQHIFKGYESGAVDYISKPFNPDILKSKVRVFVELYRSMQERQELEKEISRYENLAKIGTLAGGLAHDFNNLFMVIIGNIELALDEIKRDEIRENLKNALYASHIATELTRKLITFSEWGAPVVRKTRISDTICEAVENALEKTSCTCSYRFAEDLYEVDIDVGQIRQVFYNLAVNAAEAMPDGGEIHVRAGNLNDTESQPLLKRGMKYIEIEIHDHGIGIDDEFLSHIFDPYFSTKERGAQKGMGLGLSVAHSIIQRHEGFIDVDSSSPTDGTCMRVILPISTAPERIMKG